MARKPNADDVSTVYGYTRKSTDDHRQGVTREVQDDRLRKYIEYRFDGMNVVQGQVFHDDCTSRIGLFRRPEGLKLGEILKPGDHIVTAKLDRMFRKVIDAVTSLREIEARAVNLHILNINVDTSTTIGRFFFHMMAAAAELELGTISDRIIDAMATKRKNGHATNDRTPYGWMKVHKANPDNPLIVMKYFIPDEEEREVLRSVVELKLTMSWFEIEMLFKNQEFVRTCSQQPWSVMMLRKGHNSAVEGFPLPRDRE